MEQDNAHGARLGAHDEDYEGLEHSQYLDMWREWVDNYGDARKQHFLDEACYDGDIKGTGEGQWTKDDLKELQDRRQPPTVRNITKRKVNAIAGVEQRARSEPRAFPRTPKDQKSAEVATDSLRFVKEQSRWTMTKADRFVDGLKIGYAAVEIGGAEDHVPITPIEWKDFFFDFRSRRPDFSDGRYLGVAKWVDVEVAKPTYAPEIPEPELPQQPMTDDPAEWDAYDQAVEAAKQDYEKQKSRRDAILKVIDDTAAGGKDAPGSTDKTFDDLPRDVLGDQKRKRIFIIDLWHQDPKKGWFRCVFTGTGKLFTEQSPYIEPDQYNRKVPSCPIKAFSVYVSSDLWRYGEVRDMRPVQKDLNKRLSKSLHLLTVTQVIMDQGALPDGDVEKARKEAARPDGVLVKLPGRDIQIVRGGELAAGQMQLATEAREYLELAGANQQLQGQAGGAASGRAILALQQAGLGQLGPVFDRLHDWEIRCYRAIWARIQQFWTGEMYVRVTDDRNNARFAAVNGAPVVNTDNGNIPNAQEDPRLAMGANGGPAFDPNEEPETGPMLAELDMDIIIDRAPEAATLQAEQFEELMKLIPIYLQSGQPIPMEIAIEASSMPNKSALLDKLEAAKSEPNPAAQMQQQQGQLQLELLAKKVEELTAKIANMNADTASKGASAEKTGAEARSAGATATMDEIEAGMASGLVSRLNGSNAPQAFPAAEGTGEFWPPQ